MNGVAAISITALLALTACGPPLVQGVIPPLTVADSRPAFGPLPADLTLPPGHGPFPVVMILHGCSGPTPFPGWVERLHTWGYGALVIDSFGPRRVASVCESWQQHLVNPVDRAGDIVSAATWLQSQPGVDGHRLAVLGVSHGGSAAVAVTLHPFADRVSGIVRAAVSYYGIYGYPERYAGMPLLVLTGDEDTAPPPDRYKAFDNALPKGSPFSLIIYPGVAHAFTNPDLVHRSLKGGHPEQYDPAAAADSFTRVRAFLAQTVGQPQS